MFIFHTVKITAKNKDNLQKICYKCKIKIQLNFFEKLCYSLRSPPPFTALTR